MLGHMFCGIYCFMQFSLLDAYNLNAFPITYTVVILIIIYHRTLKSKENSNKENSNKLSSPNHQHSCCSVFDMGPWRGVTFINAANLDWIYSLALRIPLPRL